MKKIFSISLFLILIYISSVVNATTITDDLLNNNIQTLNSLLKNKIDPSKSYATEIVDENNNVPAYKYYPNHTNSRLIKTLKAYDGKIFMGLGDWDANTGPVHMVYYDTLDGQIKTSGTIPDEAVERFSIIDGTLYTTGCDPRAGGGRGSFYTYNKKTTSWVQHENSNGWVHVFDIEKFNNKLFMGGETTVSSNTPCIHASSDGGETFEPVPVFKDDTLVQAKDGLRCFELISFNNKLFAYISLFPYTGIYEYDENANQFNFYTSKPRLSYLPATSDSIIERFEATCKNFIFEDYFIYMPYYYSKDLKNFEELSSGFKICDATVVGDDLYILSGHKIYSTKNFSSFSLIYELKSTGYAMEYYDNNLYVGCGSKLYKIDLEKMTKSLKLHKDTKNIEICDNNETSLINYTLSEKNSIFETTLNFDTNMSKEQWEQEYYKLKDLSLIYTLVGNNSESEFEEAMSYFHSILSKNITKSYKTYTSAIEFADAMFTKELNIEDEQFTLVSKNISKTQNEYKTQVILTINNKTEDIIKPSEDNNSTGDKPSDNNSNSTNDMPLEDDNNSTGNKPSDNNNNSQNNTSSSNNSNNNMTLEDYLNNKHKLPQTGEFFGIKHLLQIIIIFSLLLLICHAIKKDN